MRLARLGGIVLVAFALASSSVHAQTSLLGLIRGRVVAVDGSVPLSGVVVELFATGVPGELARARTTSDADGLFVFGELPEDTYRLRVSAERFRLVGGDPLNRTEMRVAVEPGQQETIVVLRLAPGGATVFGTVTDAESALPSADWQITLLNRTYDLNGTTRIEVFASREVAPDGAFAFSGLDPGVYFLRAEPGPARSGSSAPVYYPNRIDPSLAFPLTVARDDLMSVDFRISPQRGARISGRYIDDTGDGNPFWYRAWLVPIGSPVEPIEARWQSAGAGPGGFEILNVPPGDYDMFTASSPRSPSYGSRTRVQVGAEDLAGVTAIASRGAEVRGRFEVDDPAAPDVDWSRASLNLRPSSTQATFAMSYVNVVEVESDGTFVAPGVADAEYTLRIGLPLEDLPAGAYVNRAMLNNVDVLHSEFRIQQPGNLVIELRTDGGVVTGTVEAEGARTLVLLVPLRRPGVNPAHAYRFTRLLDGPDNQFVIPSVRPGDYRLIAFEDDPRCSNSCYFSDEYLERAMQFAEPVTVAPGSSVYRSLRAVTPEQVDPLWN